MGPIATGLGEIFMYTVDADPEARKDDGTPWTATDLRTLQDWVIRPQLRNTPGVTEVNTIGGYERQIHITPDPAKLVALGLTLHDVVTAVAANNENVGAGYIERNGQQFLVRVPGQVVGLDEIRVRRDHDAPHIPDRRRRAGPAEPRLGDDQQATVLHGEAPLPRDHEPTSVLLLRAHDGGEARGKLCPLHRPGCAEVVASRCGLRRDETAAHEDGRGEDDDDTRSIS